MLGMTTFLYANKKPADSSVSGPETLCAGDAQLHRRQRALRVMMAMMVQSQHEETAYLRAEKLSNNHYWVSNKVE